MRTVFLAIGLASLAVGAQAADLPQYRPAPAWVKPVPIPDKPAGGDQAALLQVSQTRFGPAGDEVYDERAFPIHDTGDLARYGNVVLPWSPETETLVIHKLELIRGGRVIDQLDQGRKVQVLHRETNLEKAMFDGTLTATVQLEGLQVGDVIHLAVTREIHDPVLKGHSQSWSGVARPGKIGHVYISATWPASKPLHWKATEGIAQPQITNSSEGAGLVVDLTDTEAPLSPRGAPARFGSLANVQMSDFASWAEVSELMTPLFNKASTLEADSALKAEIAKIRSQSKDPKVQAFAALKLVQDQIRYLFVGLNNGNLVPAAADDTWRRRFGDCKAKTALLLALLHGLGIEAQPALVDTQTGDALPSRLPSLATFDHVAVKARIGDKTYWLDGTRLGDLSLDALETPNFHWMLPVQASGGQLEALNPTPFGEAHFSRRLELDASAGMDAPAKVHGEHLLRGDEAEGARLKVGSMSGVERERTLRSYWQQAEPWITPTAVSMTDDGRNLTLVMDGTATIPWGADSRGRIFVVKETSIGGEANFQRQPGPNADAPFAVDFPTFAESSVRVILPNKGQGFTLVNAAPIDKVVAGSQYKRSAKIDNGVAVIQSETRAVQGEFPFAEANAAAVTLRDWGLHAVMIESNPALAAAQGDTRACGAAGSPDEALKACEALLPQAASVGLDVAAVHAQIGHLHGLKHEWAAALDSFNKALVLKPDYPQALGERGLILADRRDFAAAQADFDRAIALDGKNAGPWGGRGYLYRVKGDFDRAIGDLNTAIALSPDNAWFRLNRGEAYVGKKDQVHALEDLDQSIKLDPKSDDAFAARGRLLLAQNAFQRAEQDFDKAVEIAPKSAVYRAARALARSGLKRYPDALSDFDEAIKIDPNNAAIYRARADVYVAMGAGDKAASDRQTALHLQPQPNVAQTVRPPPPLAIAPAGAQGASAPPPPAGGNDVASLTALAEFRGRNGQWREAIDAYDRAIKIDGGSSALFIGRGRAHASAKDDAGAIADFSEAIRRDPNDAQSYYQRGMAYARTKDREHALRDFNDSIRLKPTFASSLIERGRIYIDLTQYDLAIADFTQALTLQPNDAVALVNRSLVYLNRKEWAKAADDDDAALRSQPNNTAALNNRGWARRNQGRLDEAQADFDQALRLNPDYTKARENRASLLFARGAFAEANADFETLLKQDANNSSFYYSRGYGRFQMHDPDGAVRDFDQSLRLKPDNAFALAMRGAVHLLRNELDQAMLDCDAALKITPSLSMGLYLKGITERRQGKIAQGDEDVAKAKASQPIVDTWFTPAGIAP